MQPGPGSEALTLSLQEPFFFFLTVLLKSNLCPNVSGSTRWTSDPSWGLLEMILLFSALVLLLTKSPICQIYRTERCNKQNFSCIFSERI